MHARHASYPRSRRPSDRPTSPMALPPLHLRRYLSLSMPRLRRRPAPPLPVLLETTSPKRSAPRASAPATTTRRHLHMADDAVVGAAVRCARPPVPAPLPSSRKQQRVDDAGRDSSDEHYQQDVIMLRRTRSGRAFPPPISVIGKGGRPWLSLRAHREGGRLVLREMRLPSQELPLQPCKEDGRFKLLIHPEARARPCGGGTTAGTAREGR